MRALPVDAASAPVSVASWRHIWCVILIITCPFSISTQFVITKNFLSVRLEN